MRVAYEDVRFAPTSTLTTELMSFSFEEEPAKPMDETDQSEEHPSMVFSQQASTATAKNAGAAVLITETPPSPLSTAEITSVLPHATVGAHTTTKAPAATTTLLADRDMQGPCTNSLGQGQPTETIANRPDGGARDIGDYATTDRHGSL